MQLDARGDLRYITTRRMAAVDEKTVGWGLLRRRPMLVPTWRGWLALLVLALGFTAVVFRCAYPFLAVNEPVTGGVMVVEGWQPDYALKTALDDFKQGHYDRMYVTGIPIAFGAPLVEYRTYAELGAATLVKLGADTNAIRAVPAPKVRQDRTYASAVALRNWLRQQGTMPVRICLVTEGPHARRSRLLFQKAFGRNVTIGVVAVSPEEYDTEHWWRSSQGVRVVVGEALAYGYARLLFWRED